ncbi:hypothetical protein ACSQ67_017796 [Phaseolus vulgaris]
MKNLNRSFGSKGKKGTGWQVERAPLRMSLGSQRDTSILISMHLSPSSLFLEKKIKKERKDGGGRRKEPGVDVNIKCFAIGGVSPKPWIPPTRSLSPSSSSPTSSPSSSKEYDFFSTHVLYYLFLSQLNYKDLCV